MKLNMMKSQSTKRIRRQISSSSSSHGSPMWFVTLMKSCRSSLKRSKRKSIQLSSLISSYANPNSQFYPVRLRMTVHHSRRFLVKIRMISKSHLHSKLEHHLRLRSLFPKVSRVSRIRWTSMRMLQVLKRRCQLIKRASIREGRMPG